MSGPGEDVAGRTAGLLRPGGWPFRALASVAIALLVTLNAVLSLNANFLEGYRVIATDRNFPSGPTSEDIVVVEFDPSSEPELGWPIPRSGHAAVVRNLAAAGATVIGYDITFDLPAEGDDELAAAIADAGNVVLASAGTLRPAPAGRLFTTDPTVDPVPVLAEAAREIGHANVFADTIDGVVRTLPAALDLGPRAPFRPALSVAAAAIHEGRTTLVSPRPDGVDVGGQFHPTTGLGLLIVSYTDPLTPDPDDPPDDPDRPRLSAGDVMRGTFDPSAVDGKLVFVGVTDRLLGDHVDVPRAKSGGTPGVYVHANAANTILTARYKGALQDTTTLVVVFVTGLLVALGSLALPLRWSPLIVLAVIAAFLLLADVRFEEGEPLDQLYTTFGVLTAYLVAVALRYFTEIREKRRVAGLFSQYVPKKVAESLIEQGRATASLEGERLEISVFFCDLRGFTATAAELEPREVRDLLNRYYEHTTRIILKHGGTVMQYVGDEVFAIFGAPVLQDDHAQRAVRAAIEVQNDLPSINADLAELGMPPIAFGIGLNSGPVVAAHVGDFHKQYAVVGDTVNVGARLCSLAKADQITMTGALSDQLDGTIESEPYGEVQLKGVSRDPRVQYVLTR